MNFGQVLAERHPEVKEKADKVVADNAHLLNKPGYIARASEGKIEVLPWQKSTRRGNTGDEWREPDGFIPEHIIRHARESLPPRPRRTGAQRLEGMTKMLIDDAVQAMKRTGKPVVARSIVDEICRAAALGGMGFMDPAKVERMTLEEIRPHLEALAKRQFIEAGHKQAESDRHKVVLDHHGHLNHQAVRAKEVPATG